MSNPPSNNSDEPEASAIAVTPLGLTENKYFGQQRQQHKKILWAIFGLLLILVIGVFFILPRYVAAPTLEPTVIVVDTGGPSANPVSPFQEAQQLRQREAAQNVLADLLTLQESLQDKQVEQWSGAEFTDAIEQARAGDEAYSQQDFVDARDSYQRGLNILQAVEASLPQVFDRTLAIGQNAILAGNADAAIAAFTLAEQLYPDRTQASTGRARALLLSEVLELLMRGNDHHEEGQLEAAQALYQQALSVDSAHVGASNLLSTVNTDIVERDFAGFMSSGYAAIQAGAPERAKAAFTQALSIKANSTEALTALAQASDQITSTAIDKLLISAQEHEANERWQQALNAYNDALAIDPNLVAAVSGRNRSNSRLNLDLFLETTINEPLRLADAPVYAQTTQVHNDASTISSPGQRLQSQLGAVQALLQQVTQAVDVSFRSNGLTDVTIYQVTSLGQFTAQTLALTPGTYIAVGVRDGFRDVREEFTISFNHTGSIITIQCDEEIL